MKKAVKRIAAIVILLTVCIGLYFTGMVSKAETSNTIYEGIYLEDLELSGMTKEGMNEAIETYVETILSKSITLQTHAGEQEIVSLKSIGCIWTNPEVLEEVYIYGRKGNLVERYLIIQDLKETNKQFGLTFSIDEEIANEFIKVNFNKYNTEVVDAIYERLDGEIVITPEIQGKVCNHENTVLEIKEEIENNWKNEKYQILVSFDSIDAVGTEIEYSQMIDVLGTFTTSYRTSSWKRSGNVANGCSKIDGTFLYPGDTLSVYDLCQPFTYENGYFDAGAYLDGIVVESIGGGSCQVTTTLYNAAIRAELEIVEREPHSMVVPYVKLAEDSAISGTYKDLKFTNTLEHPIYIEGITTEDKQITFTMYGIDERAENREIRFVSEKISQTIPETERIVQDAEFGLGYLKIQSVHYGYKARLWKVITVDEVETERVLINESKYNAAPRTLIVGIGGSSTDIAAAIGAAAATGSIAEVQATVANILATPAP